MSELEALHGVQELDTRIFELSDREENHPLKQELEELEEEAAANQVVLDEAVSLLEESRKKQGRMEEEVQRVEDKLGREEGKLYDGKVTNPKELRGLQAEVRSIKKKKDTLETELLEEMERQDEMKLRLDDLQSNQERLQGEVGEKEETLRKEMEEIAANRAELEKQRDELRAGIDAELLELYEHLLESKHRLAVVKVVDGVCQGCRVELPGMEYDRFLKSDDVFRCTNCGRIMVK